MDGSCPPQQPPDEHPAQPAAHVAPNAAAQAAARPARNRVAAALGGLACAALVVLAGELIDHDGLLAALHLIAAGFAAVCAVAALIGSIYTLLAGVLVRRYFARPSAEPAGTDCPPVTVVRPLHGDECGLERNLDSFFVQDYPGDMQFVFGVHDANDPALCAVDAVRRRHPDAHVTVIADARLYGPNRKISNTLNMLPHARHDILVFADSDVRVERDYVRRAVAALQTPGAGLVTCAYRGEAAPGLWSRLSAAAVNYQFLPGVVTGQSLGLAHPCLGPTIAMTRATLDAIGGLEQYVHHLAEDYEIGRSVRQLGLRVVMPPFTITHTCDEESFVGLVEHKLRWSRTIRFIDPVSHFGSALMHPVAFAALATLASGGARWAVLALAVAFGAQFAARWLIDRALKQRCREWWVPPLWDIASFVLFVMSFSSRRVNWRGFSFNVTGQGLLSPVRDE